MCPPLLLPAVCGKFLSAGKEVVLSALFNSLKRVWILNLVSFLRFVHLVATQPSTSLLGYKFYWPYLHSETC